MRTVTQERRNKEIEKQLIMFTGFSCLILLDIAICGSLRRGSPWIVRTLLTPISTLALNCLPLKGFSGNGSGSSLAPGLLPSGSP